MKLFELSATYVNCIWLKQLWHNALVINQQVKLVLLRVSVTGLTSHSRVHLQSNSHDTQCSSEQSASQACIGVSRCHWLDFAPPGTIHLQSNRDIPGTMFLSSVSKSVYIATTHRSCHQCLTPTVNMNHCQHLTRHTAVYVVTDKQSQSDCELV